MVDGLPVGDLVGDGTPAEGTGDRTFTGRQRERRPVVAEPGRAAGRPPVSHQGQDHRGEHGERDDQVGHVHDACGHER